jgi:hypothetical protein
MKRLMIVSAACAVVGLCSSQVGLRADEPAKVKNLAKQDPAKELPALQKEWTDAQETFRKAYAEAKTDDERQQVLKEKRPNAGDFAERFLKLAETYPDSPEAISALAWIVGNAGGSPAGQKALPKLKEKLSSIADLDELYKSVSGAPAYNLMMLAPVIAEKAKKNLDHPQALPLLIWVCSATAYSGSKPDLAKLYNSTVDLLMDRFVGRKELAPLAEWLPIDDDPPWAEKHLRRLMEKNSDDEVKANARFGLASVLENKDEGSQPEAEKIFRSFAADPTHTDLAEKAKEEIEEMKVRGIGKPAPEIAGDDLDSKAFKLSDYKGKVILLDFWGFW